MNVFLRTFLAAWAACALASTLAAKPPASKPPKPAVPSGPLYFFNIQLDPRYQIVGLGPLTAQQAATANCYRFNYGARGKLESIEFDRAGVPMSDPFFNAAKIDYDYAPGVEHRWYRNGLDQTVANLNGVEGEELTLNAAGYPTQVTNRDDAGGAMRDNAGVMRVDRTLDSQYRVVRGRRTGLLGIFIRDNDGYFETRTVYDSQSRTVEYDNYDSSGQPLNDEDGVASVRTTYAVLPGGNQVTESYFDATGQPVEEKSTGIHERQSAYDPRGFLVSEAYFDASGAPTTDATTGIHEHRYVYDERGNQTSDEFYGTDGQPKNQRVIGYARVNYQYDDKNRVSEKSFVGDDGLPQVVPSVGAAVIRQEYDDHGNIVRRQFFDGQGVPSLHATYDAPAIRIQVKGDTTIVTLRDANDNPATNPINGYSSFSYKTHTDKPLTRHNLFYDQNGRSMSYFRVAVIRPHLYKLRYDRSMRRKAHWGIVAAGIGALIAMFLALRKASYTKRRKIYVPTPFERFLGWFSVFALIEGTLCFLITIWWAYVDYQNGSMGWGVYAINGVVILFFAYRLPRMRVTMRVLNISRDDIHKLVRDYFAKAQLKPEYREQRNLYRTTQFSVRIVYFASKAHAYLKLRYRHHTGRDLMRGFAQYVRLQVGTMEAPPRSRAIALYYPCVAFAYFTLAFLAFYTFFQMVRP
jgi:YD repeat-containing protein